MPSFHAQRITGFLHQRRAAAVPAAPAPVTKQSKPKDSTKTRHAIRDEVFRSFKRS